MVFGFPYIFRQILDTISLRFERQLISNSREKPKSKLIIFRVGDHASLLRRGSSIRYINPLCEAYRRHKVEWIDQAENRLPHFPPSPATLCLHLHYSADPPHPKKNPLSLCGGERDHASRMAPETLTSQSRAWSVSNVTAPAMKEAIVDCAASLLRRGEKRREFSKEKHI